MAQAHVSHVEWCCKDIETTAAFLQTLFGWEFKAFGNNYLLSNPDKGPVVGLLRSEKALQGDNCLAFVAVDDIETKLKQTESLGGRVHVAKTAIPDYGWYAQLKDPLGNIVGLFESERLKDRG